tara:strand:+ start:12417 stop:13028 length:612 start_codon:yes stop_codon:yes gene_type:complete
MSQQLRREIRAKRRTLSQAEQQRASAALTDILPDLKQYRCAKRLAFYAANDGEIDAGYLLQNALAMGKTCYLPVLHPLQQKRLHFAEYHDSTRLVNNRFGIPEPHLPSGRIAPIWTLDIIFLPLVAFDRRGNRLGMGGGFYDRTLTHLRNRPGRRTGMIKPWLIGLAHSCQEVIDLQPRPWDIALDMVATEKELITINRRRRE